MFLVIKLVFVCPKNRTIDSNQEEKLQGTKRNGCALTHSTTLPYPKGNLELASQPLILNRQSQRHWFHSSLSE